MVRVRLRADQGTIQSQVNLFDDGVRQIVGDPEFFVGRQVGPSALFQLQVHREVTAIQIHMVVQRGNDEFHGVDASRGGLNGHHAISIDADVHGRDLEYLQRGADDFGGLSVRGLCHVDVEEEFSTSSSSSLSSVWSGSTCRGVFIPSSSSGQLLDQIKLAQAFHTGGQPSSVLRQSPIVAYGPRARMHGGHFLFSHPLLQTPKMSRAFLVCLGNRALATRTVVLTFLLDKAFLARLLISFSITCSALRLTPRANPAFNPRSVLLGAFKGFRVLLRVGLAYILMSIFTREIEFPDNSTVNLSGQVSYKYGIRSMKFFFLKKIWCKFSGPLTDLETQRRDRELCQTCSYWFWTK